MDYVVRDPVAMVGTAVAALYDAMSNSIGPLLGGGDGTVDDPMEQAAIEYLTSTEMFSPTAPGRVSSQTTESINDPADSADEQISETSVRTRDSRDEDIAQYGQGDLLPLL